MSRIVRERQLKKPPLPHLLLRLDPMPNAPDMCMFPNTATLLAIALAALVAPLSRQQIRMLIDPMTLMHGNMLVVAKGIVTTRRPSEIIAPDLYIIVCELAQLIIVHADQFGFIRGAQVQAGNQVDGPREKEGDDKGPARGGEDVGDLDVELFISVVDPAAGNDAGVDAVESDDVGCAEECIG